MGIKFSHNLPLATLPTLLPPRPQRLHVDALVVSVVGFVGVVGQALGPEVFHVPPLDGVGRYPNLQASLHFIANLGAWLIGD